MKSKVTQESRLDYLLIPPHPVHGKPELYRLWIALILTLIKDLKGTSNYYDVLPMTIKEIIGTDAKTASLKELLDMVRNNTALIEELRKDLTTLEGKFNNYVEVTDARLAIIEGDIEEIFRRLDQVDANIIELKNYVDRLVSALDVRVTNLENRVTGIEGDITRINNRIDEVIEMIENLKNYIDGNFIPADAINGVTKIVVSPNDAPTGPAAAPYIDGTLWIKVNM